MDVLRFEKVGLLQRGTCSKSSLHLKINYSVSLVEYSKKQYSGDCREQSRQPGLTM